ncbi:MAG: CoA-transferase [Gammaproteobacteria bacterium]
MNGYSARELMAIVLARDLADGEELQVGIGLPVADAAVRLAHILHGPNMDLVFFGVRMNVHHLECVPLPRFGWDCRVVRWAESFADRGHRFDQVKDWGRRVFFIGGVQVDMYGNANLIGLGEDYSRLRFRGPGSVGTPTLTTHVGRYHLVLNHHSPRVLVPRCDYVSAMGYGDGGDARERLGLPGGGPRYCVTPLAVMDFAPDSRRMRLKSVHPGVAVEDVRRATGFDLVLPADVPVTEPPSDAELRVLRTRVDPQGTLRD